MIRKISGILGLVLALVAVFSVFPCTMVQAELVPSIQDDADLLTAAEEAALYEDMLPLCEYGTPLFWTTTRQSANYERLAEQYYYSMLGNGESGTLFVINMAARQLTIYSDGQIYRVVTNGEAETITDNVFRLARDGKYYECAQSVFQQELKLMQGEQIARPMKIVSNALLALVLALLGVYLYISRRYEDRPKSGKNGAVVPVTVAGAAAVFTATNLHRSARMTKQKKINIRSDSGGGGGGHGGGGFSGGGGGHSGGGGSHGF